MWSVTSPTISIVIPPSLSFSALRRLGHQVIILLLPRSVLQALGRDFYSSTGSFN